MMSGKLKHIAGFAVPRKEVAFFDSCAFMSFFAHTSFRDVAVLHISFK
jgi:hypothetical protein